MSDWHATSRGVGNDLTARLLARSTASAAAERAVVAMRTSRSIPVGRQRSEHRDILRELPRLVALDAVVSVCHATIPRRLSNVADPEQRLPGTIGANLVAMMLGGALRGTTSRRRARLNVSGPPLRRQSDATVLSFRIVDQVEGLSRLRSGVVSIACCCCFTDARGADARRLVSRLTYAVATR